MLYRFQHALVLWAACFSVSGKAVPAKDIAQRFFFVGVISAASSDGKPASVALIKDGESGRSVLLRHGQSLPYHDQWHVSFIDRDVVKVKSGPDEISLSPFLAKDEPSVAEEDLQDQPELPKDPHYPEVPPMQTIFGNSYEHENIKKRFDLRPRTNVHSENKEFEESSKSRDENSEEEEGANEAPENVLPLEEDVYLSSPGQIHDEGPSKSESY